MQPRVELFTGNSSPSSNKTISGMSPARVRERKQGEVESALCAIAFQLKSVVPFTNRRWGLLNLHCKPSVILASNAKQ